MNSINYGSLLKLLRKTTFDTKILLVNASTNKNSFVGSVKRFFQDSEDHQEVFKSYDVAQVTLKDDYLVITYI